MESGWGGWANPGPAGRCSRRCHLFYSEFPGRRLQFFGLQWLSALVKVSGKDLMRSPPSSTSAFLSSGCRSSSSAVACSLPHFLARRAAQKTCYALTDRRAIIWEPRVGGVRVRSYRPEQLSQLSRCERSDGSGDLIFEEISTIYGNGRRLHYGRSGFVAIDRVREIEMLVRKTLLHDA